MLLIRDVQIVDGRGNPPFRNDVLVNKGRISAIGNFPKQDVDEVIDGLGGYLCPGFIDVNTVSDHYLTLFTNPEQEYFLKQGVTTIVGGMCGASLAPLLYGSLESIRKWAEADKISVNWHTTAEFLKNLNRFKIGVNFATFAGHSTIRRALIGKSFRNLTASEIDVFKKILKDSFKEGASGFSVGLSYAHAKGTPYSELKNFAEVVAEEKKIFAIHLRDEHKGLVNSVKEVIKLAGDTGVKIIISHFRPLIGFEKEFDEGMKLLDNADFDIHFDSYPSDTSLVPIYTLLPEWNKKDTLEKMLLNIRDVNSRGDILSHLPEFKEKDIIIADAPKLEYLLGKTLGEFASNQNLNLKEAFLKLMDITNLRAVLFYKNVNIDLAIESLTHEEALASISIPKTTSNTTQKIIK